MRTSREPDKRFKGIKSLKTNSCSAAGLLKAQRSHTKKENTYMKKICNKGKSERKVKRDLNG